MFQDEAAFLAPFASLAKDSRGRVIKEAGGVSTRSDFQRDRDRIIHCAAFRQNCAHVKYRKRAARANELDHPRTKQKPQMDTTRPQLH